MLSTFRMETRIKFNRPINKDTDYISIGSYEMKMAGKIISFDFENYEGYIDSDDPCILNTLQKNPDYEDFPDLDEVTEEMLSNVEEIIEFNIYTGESGENDIVPVSIEKIVFILPYDNWKETYVSDDILKDYIVK